MLDELGRQGFVGGELDGALRRRVAGFAWYKDHCTYLPMSGSITAELADELSGFVTAKGSVQFPTDEPLPADLIARLVGARRREIAGSAR